MRRFPNEKYSIILADPPWRYKNYGYAKTKTGQRAKRGCEKEYPTLSIEEICALPVQDITADDAALFLWVTFPLLDKIWPIFPAWGFEYKTKAFTWIKRYPKSGSLFWGMGNFTRANDELCLLGVKGKPKRVSASVHSVIEAPIGRHSAKPAEARDRIVKLMGDLPRIELFAREQEPGWAVWGNEV